MMYLTEPKMSSVVMKQYKYKLNSYIGALTSLIMIQIIAILLSFASTGMSATGTELIEISVYYYYTADFVIICTMLWAAMTAITITTKAYRFDDFSFVTNRITSNLSNIVFLITISVIGAVTAILSSFFIKTIMYFIFDLEKMMVIQASFIEYVVGIVALCFYLLLFSAIGYFIGTLYQVSKASLFLSIALLITAIILLGIPIEAVFQFFAFEESIGMFIVKVLITVLGLFVTSSAMSNKLEVK